MLVGYCPRTFPRSGYLESISSLPSAFMQFLEVFLIRRWWVSRATYNDHQGCTGLKRGNHADLLFPSHLSLVVGISSQSVTHVWNCKV